MLSRADRAYEQLEELMELHKAKLGEDDRWRVYTYSKCTQQLRIGVISADGPGRYSCLAQLSKENQIIQRGPVNQRRR
jgi:hypothetical protein